MKGCCTKSPRPQTFSREELKWRRKKNIKTAERNIINFTSFNQRKCGTRARESNVKVHIDRESARNPLERFRLISCKNHISSSCSTMRWFQFLFSALRALRRRARLFAIYRYMLVTASAIYRGKEEENFPISANKHINIRNAKADFRETLLVRNDDYLLV